MLLNKVTLSCFRNIREAQLEFSPKINCISGNNGAGKTNLLDAVYYLSMTKSFFSSSDQYIYSYDADEAVLCGCYTMDNGTEEKIAASVKRGGEKIFKRGAKAYERFSQHIGLIPVVMVSPMDSSLINDSGEGRRRYMNFILSQTDREYLRHIQAYNQLLLQRNKLLKADTVHVELLDTLSLQMTPHAAYIYKARKDLCVALLPMVQDFYARLSRGNESVSVGYVSDLDDAPLDELLIRDAEKERILHYTTAGIQRDDLGFLMNGHPIKRCGSQGQQKSFLLAMKLSQYLFIRQIYAQTPILLLDDVFDKLDPSRVEDLLSIVSALDFGQIFITDCNKVRLDGIAGRIGAECRHFYVENGNVTQL